MSHIGGDVSDDSGRGDKGDTIAEDLAGDVGYRFDVVVGGAGT